MLSKYFLHNQPKYSNLRLMGYDEGAVIEIPSHHRTQVTEGGRSGAVRLENWSANTAELRKPGMAHDLFPQLQHYLNSITILCT